MIVGVTCNNGTYLAHFLANIAPQLTSNDVLLVCDSSPGGVGSRLVERFKTSRTPTFTLSLAGKTIYEQWNIVLSQRKGTTQEGILICNDDIVMPMSFISALKNAHKKTAFECIVPTTTPMGVRSTSIDPNFRWYGSSLITVTPTKWMPGFCFYLRSSTVDRYGDFCTDYKIWYGDTEYNRRLKRIGRLTNEFVFHFNGGSFAYGSDAVCAQIARDKEQFEAQV